MQLQDKITLFPPDDAETDREERILVFMITGNPGLIEYYRGFLADVQRILSQSTRQSTERSSDSGSGNQSASRNLVFHGVSFLGFELEGNHNGEHGPYTLRETIDGVKRALLHAVGEYGGGSSSTSETAAAGTGRKKPLRVILLGHSVGAYVLLEVVEWWRRVQAGEAGPRRGINGAVGASSAMKIAAGVCLFPTVVDIALSPRGRILTPLLRVRGLAVVISTLTRLLLLFVPTFLLSAVISILLMEKHAADTTAAWLKSAHGVRQTVFLGNYEMQEIAADRWSADTWGSRVLESVTESVEQRNSKGERTKLFFLWGEHDHWVDNIRRDRLIARRTTRAGHREAGLPWMEIDSTGVPHAFCVTAESSRYVAEKVAGWIREVV